jgi:hypothetical protein
LCNEELEGYRTFGPFRLREAVIDVEQAVETVAGEILE